MAVRTLEQIVSELDNTYNPYIQNVRRQQAEIPKQIEDEERGLQARQTQAFDDILGGARRRGLGFSGIPISEQAKYTSTEFLPALARLRSQGRQQALSLEDAVLNTFKERNTLAQQLRQQDVDNDFRERQFGEQVRQANITREDARRASSGGGVSLGGGFGTVNSAPASQPNAGKATAVKPQDQMLFNQMFVKPGGGQWSDRDLVNDYNATLKSARYGNARDRQKILFYHSFRSDLFGAGVPALVMSNGSQLRF